MLLLQARLAGLQVTTSGDQLVVRGPRRLETMARALLAEKPQVMRALAVEGEVGWRIEAMRPQLTAQSAIHLLLARPGIPFEPRSCCSCGDALAASDRYRCGPCVAAAVAVLGTVG